MHIRTRKAMVVSVDKPKIAHEPGTLWEATVVYGVQKGNQVYKRKKQVFVEFFPRIGEWIEIVPALATVEPRAR